MNKILVVVIVVIVLLGAGYYFMKGSYAPAPATIPTSQTQTNTSTPATPNTVTIKGYAFQPDTLTVSVGSTVTWVNEDSVTHSVKSSTFSSQNLATGDKYQFTFNTKGTFTYNCGIHPTMTGTINVQ